MSALELAATMGFDNYRPGIVVDAVNELLPLGRAGALDRIDQENQQLGLFWVLRVLFDPPLPELALGRPTTPPPEDPDALPRFPIVLALDVPFLVVRGYDLGGKAEPVSAHVAWLREHGILRDGPLRPASDPEAVREAFEVAWRAAYRSDHLDAVLSLVDQQLISVSS